MRRFSSQKCTAVGVERGDHGGGQSGDGLDVVHLLDVEEARADELVVLHGRDVLLLQRLGLLGDDGAAQRQHLDVHDEDAEGAGAQVLQVEEVRADLEHLGDVEVGRDSGEVNRQWTTQHRE